MGSTKRGEGGGAREGYQKGTEASLVPAVEYGEGVDILPPARQAVEGWICTKAVPQQCWH